MKRTITLMALSAWVLVPTGTPDDVITFFIIEKLGPQIYAGLLVVLLALMWYYKINLKKIKQAMKGLWQTIKRSIK